MKALILAGGGGTRLWPLSRQGNPKQLHALFGGRSLLQTTYDRLRKKFAPGDILILASVDQRDQIRSSLPDLPEDRFIWEPCRRDTAAAIGFALLHVAKEDPLSTFVVINSDAYVREPDEYLRVIALAGREATKRPVSAVLIGIPPTYPETGYGYIKTGEFVGAPDGGEPDDRLFAVERFVEKPDAAKAKGYLEHGGYLWNPTLIVGCADRFLGLYARHLPQHAAIFSKIRPWIGEPGREADIAREFAALPSVSVDYGILEKENGLLVLPAEFGWSDVGNWRAVRDILGGGKGRAGQGLELSIESSGNLTVAPPGRLIALVGVDNLAVIETDDALLVCPLALAQQVKQVVEGLAKDPDLRKFL